MNGAVALTMYFPEPELRRPLHHQQVRICHVSHVDRHVIVPGHPQRAPPPWTVSLDNRDSVADDADKQRGKTASVAEL